MQTLSVTSSAFGNDRIMSAVYTCDGKNINPPLSISNIPAGTKSLALIVEDPDAPLRVWDHWVRYNIPANTTVIKEGQEPEGSAGSGTAGNKTYSGPCPPSGTHHYHFKVFALSDNLTLAEGATKDQVLTAMQGKILAQGELVGLYSRDHL
ncbi:YbhB/YbcL family Raf kinase inhibitor-like protein [Candidatus Parcubacteria bacterium]|nr:YbhB/YbcL family Raf kinase inhibitor-like protein [Candidatus Parcubacteria bacterium]